MRFPDNQATPKISTQRAKRNVLLVWTGAVILECVVAARSDAYVDAPMHPLDQMIRDAGAIVRGTVVGYRSESDGMRVAKLQVEETLKGVSHSAIEVKVTETWRDSIVLDSPAPFASS